MNARKNVRVMKAGGPQLQAAAATNSPATKGALRRLMAMRVCVSLRRSLPQLNTGSSLPVKSPWEWGCGDVEPYS